jgi:crotonobetaine/carnitine-CoA ligase
VRDAAVIGMPGELGDDDIRAFVVLEAGASLEAPRIHEALSKRISFFKVPRYIRLVDDYPRTIKSEPERKQLRAIPIDALDWDAEAGRVRKPAMAGNAG